MILAHIDLGHIRSRKFAGVRDIEADFVGAASRGRRFGPLRPLGHHDHDVEAGHARVSLRGPRGNDVGQRERRRAGGRGTGRGGNLALERRLGRDRL